MQPQPEFRQYTSLRLGQDLNRGEVRTVLWATGFRPDHSRLEVPVFDRKGRIRHDGGVVDARELSAHLAAHLRSRTVAPALAAPRLYAARALGLPILPTAGRG